jgi:hypothetical protein
VSLLMRLVLLGGLPPTSAKFFPHFWPP